MENLILKDNFRSKLIRDGILFHSVPSCMGEVKDSRPLNTTETGDKRMGRLTRKGCSF